MPDQPQTPAQKFTLKNLDCAVCAAKIEEELQRTPGVRSASLNFAACTLALDADDLGAVRQVITAIEPGVELEPLDGHRHRGAEEEAPDWPRLVRLGIAGVFWLLGLVFHARLHGMLFGVGEYLILGGVYLLVGLDVLKAAWRNLRAGNWFDENFLMSIATIGAFAIHEIPEAIGVMLFYQVGEYVQDRSLARSRRSIQALLAVRPDTAHRKTADGFETVDPEAVAVGETIIVRPGERIPLDGMVTAGQALLNTAALTGESVPRRAAEGIGVLAGMISRDGLLEIRVEKPFAESSVVRMMELVEHAANRKAQTERFITRFARVYTPAVVIAAALLAVVPPLLLPGARFADWLYRALVLLVISCPCALMISVPLGYFGGLGAASKAGILIKGANFLETLSQVRTVVFDKTGTLTRGVFAVQEVVPHAGHSAAELLEAAAYAEASSTHPIALSILQAYGHPVDRSRIRDVEETPGKGIRARVDDVLVSAGNDAYLHHLQIPHGPECCELSGTLVHVSRGGDDLGYIRIGDELKPESLPAMRALRAEGVQRLVMLSGDHAAIAADTARDLELDHAHGSLLPEDKLRLLEEYMHGAGHAVAFVGDGINDAPVIARADVGFAMGALGSDAAIETADVVLMADDPARVAQAIAIGKRTRRIVWQNIAFALGVKGAVMLLGAFGIVNIWLAVIADVGVALLAVLNAARAMGGSRG
ncbi:MAG: cadmium-translocating P-type ATPase [Anaerolineae bacterium]|nr:cadmium-translocating P-type ATPase [Anaerolineae bacterium]